MKYVYEVYLQGVPMYERSFGLYSTSEKAHIKMNQIHTEQFLDDPAYNQDYSLTVRERVVDEF